MSGGVIMRRKTASKRGRLLPLLAACGFGYLTGALHLATVREVGGSSAAQAVALRFPKEWTASPAITLAAVKNADVDLFRPVPMAPASQMKANADQPVLDHATQEPATLAPVPRVAQTASLDSAPTPTGNGLDPAPRPVAGEVAKVSAARAHAAGANRAGYILDDAQIASIKGRLHLTPDQERMWPAVEAALRNMAYKRTQQAAVHGAARNVQAAAVDPQAVDGLKSAAVPLIMSFSSEQKEEVRNLAHVMGLDQLASQF
jgi:hypothetical protein